MKDWEEFWASPQGKQILAEEREKIFAGEKGTVTVEAIDRIFEKYRDLVRETDWQKK